VQIKSVSETNDGKYIVSGSEDQSIKITSLQLKNEIGTLIHAEYGILFLGKNFYSYFYKNMSMIWWSHQMENTSSQEDKIKGLNFGRLAVKKKLLV